MTGRHRARPLDHGLLNLRWAGALMDGLVRSGVEHAVVSPGSRSTPLTLAAARHPGLRTWAVPDERSAAFFALGLTKATGSPACVVATSGSAPANWFPAVIEAAADRQPLILLSADRPEELHECGANQTVDQTRLFGSHARWFLDLPMPDGASPDFQHARVRAAQAVDRSRWPLPGPVHINLPFREPLLPVGQAELPAAGDEAIPAPRYPRLAPAPADVEELAGWLSGARGMVVCGPAEYPAGFAHAVTRLGGRLACPVLADPLSGLRFGPHDRSRVLVHYDAWLRRRDGGDRPDWVLRFGAEPTSKALQQYLRALPAGSVALVVPHAPWPDPGERSGRVMHADPEILCLALADAALQAGDESWWRTCREAEQRAGRLVRAPDRVPLEASVLGLLAHALPEHSTVFCGNSLVIRDADSFLPGGPQPVRLLGNRGASGIDGNVSTLLGLAAGSDGPVVGLLGDLALYHDMNGLLQARGLSATLVVFNNHGGAIFGYLPQAELPEFERLWLTPTHLDLAKVSALYDLNHTRVRDTVQFETALHLSLQASGVDLIEVMVDRKDSLTRHRTYWDAVTEARAGSS